MRTSILRLPRLLALTGLSKSTVYELMARESFPANFPLGCRAVGWNEEDVAEWLRQRQRPDCAPVRSDSESTGNRGDHR